MNKKGQVFTVVVLLIGFIIVYALFGHEFLTTATDNMIETHGFTGGLAWLVGNMDIWLLLSVFMSALLAAFFGGSS